MSAPCVHNVSLGVKNFENKINSRQLQSDSKEHQQEVYDYVQESLGGDFKQFQPAENETHRWIFMRSFLQHYPEFRGHTLKYLMHVICIHKIQNMEKLIKDIVDFIHL